MIVHKTALTPLRVLLVACALFAPAGVPAQREQAQSPEDGNYGSKFFDQLRTIFGRFRDADLDRAFQQAKPIQCSELVGRKGEWRPVAFFNEDRKLGDWCRESLEEVKSDLTVYTFKGVCTEDRGSVQVSTEFPIAASVEDYDQQRIRLDQVDVNVNDPVTAVFNARTMAYAFELPYLFLIGRQGSVNTYSFVAPNRDAAYATDMTSRWECRAVSSNDVTYRFLICRTATVPRGAAARRQSREPSFGGSAYFILSDGTEAQTSVNLSFGDGAKVPENLPAAEPSLPSLGSPRPTLRKPERPGPDGLWQTPGSGSKVVDVGREEFRLRFSTQTWTGKIGSPELLLDQKMSDLRVAKPREGVDYCLWHPGDPGLVGRLLADPPAADVSCSLDTRDKSSRSAASVTFDLKTRSGVPLGRLQCYFPRAESAADVTLDRWVSVVGGHLTLEIRHHGD
jgi:hypothetical protein